MRKYSLKIVRISILINIQLISFHNLYLYFHYLYYFPTLQNENENSITQKAVFLTNLENGFILTYCLNDLLI